MRSSSSEVSSPALWFVLVSRSVRVFFPRSRNLPLVQVDIGLLALRCVSSAGANIRWRILNAKTDAKVEGNPVLTTRLEYLPVGLLAKVLFTEKRYKE
jgi:hypothetical protein